MSAPLDTLHLVNLRADGRSPLSHRPVTAHLPQPSSVNKNPPPLHPSSGSQDILSEHDGSKTVTGEACYASGLTSVKATVVGPFATNKVPANHSKPPLTITITAPVGMHPISRQPVPQTVSLCSYQPFQGHDLNQSKSPATARMNGYLHSVLSVFESR